VACRDAIDLPIESEAAPLFDEWRKGRLDSLLRREAPTSVSTSNTLGSLLNPTTSSDSLSAVASARSDAGKALPATYARRGQRAEF